MVLRRRLFLCGYLGQVGESLTTLELRILNDASVGIAREVASPLDESATLSLARGDWVQTNGADNAGVAELRLGRDDGVGDVVVDRLFVYSSATSNAIICICLSYAVLLLLHLQNSAILE